jgi:CheY-like chemotaxis protein
MILVMSDSKENQATGQRLAASCHDEVRRIDQLNQGLSETKDQLIILDIDTDDKILRCLDPATFADTLIKHGLPSQVHSVVFLVSDSNPDQNLRTFSRAFIDELGKQFSHPVTAYVPTDLNYGSTLIEPPIEQSDDWCVFGIRQSESIEDKRLLWEGQDILAWISSNEKAVHTLPKDINKIRFAL